TISVCLGPYMAGQCWSFAIPLFELLGVCDAVNGAIEDAISKAEDFIAEGKDKLMSLGGGGGSSGGRSESGGFTNYNLGSYAVSSGANDKVRVEGDPKPFAGWLRKQSEEVVNKLTDLPDIYFYYPDPQSIVGAFKPKNMDQIKAADLRGLEKILTVVNSLPLIRIETEQVNFKFPALTSDEIEKFKNDSQMWLQDVKKQWEAVRKNWENSEYQTQVAEIDALIDSVEKNLETLEDYKNFPRELLKWRNIESFYLKQIICYLDAIINDLGGWVLLNKQRIDQWVKAYYDAKKAIKDWQAIFQLAVDYQSSCDQCKTSKLSLFKLLIKLFVFIPEPPIIALPKWPDIVIDLSQIQAGLTVLWPEIRFVPEPLLIPSLPRLQIPTLPTVSLTIPTIPLLPALPALPQLPVLPGIPIPDLPDIPPPPKIPALPQSVSVALEIAKGVMKIICLIQSGIVPVSEATLKTQIEQMTQRPLSPVLPIDLSAVFQLDPIGIDFVDRIEVISYINLGLNFDGILKLVETAADESNDIVTDLVDLANETAASGTEAAGEIMNTPSQELQDLSDEVDDMEVEVELEDTENGEESSFIPSLQPGPQTTLDTEALMDQLYAQEAADLRNHPLLQPYLSQWEQNIKTLTQVAEEQAYIVASTPERYHLTATDHLLAFSDEEVETHFASIQAGHSAQTLKPLADSPLDELRDGLLSYFEDETQHNQQLAALLDGGEAEWDQVSRWIASQNEGGGEEATVSSLLAQTNAPTNSTPRVEATSPSDTVQTKSAFDEMRSWVVDTFSTVGKNPLDAEVEELDMAKDRYLAQSSETDGSSGTGTGTDSTVVNTGLFLYNEELQVNERLVDYTGEADSESHVVFMDMENDDDNDIVYAYGGNVYLKENFTNTDETLEYYDDAPSIVSLEELLPQAPIVDLYRSTEANNGEASVAWKADAVESMGYEIYTTDHLEDFEADNPRGLHWSHVLKEFAPASIMLQSIDAEGELATLTHETALPGTPVVTAESEKATFTYLDAEIELDEKTRFILPDLTYGSVRLSSFKGDVNLEGGQVLRNLVQESGTIALEPGELVHAIEESELTLSNALEDRITLTLPANTVMPLATSLSSGFELRVEEGMVEVLGEATTDEPQTLIEGMLILENERVDFTRSVDIEIRSTTTTVVTSYIKSGDYRWQTLSNDQEPSLILPMDNGDYYSKMRTMLSDGGRGTWGQVAHLYPQICGDKQAPYPNVGSTQQKVSVYKTLTLDGSGSFDSNSAITRYYWDTDVTLDQDGDGNATNDVDYYRDANPLTDTDGDGIATNDQDDSTLPVGPYDSLDTQNFKLWVVDEAGNTAGSTASVTVFTPDIHLSAAAGKTGVVEGAIDPIDSDIPFVLVRQRNGIYETIETPSADSNGRYSTDEKGKFIIDDLNLEEDWIVTDSFNNEVATIDPETGEIVLL
ncbi:MAG: hypothetical protein ACD_28C00065G0001, partial [uncultured bacterium]